MHAVLTLQVSVGVGALNLHRHRLDARLVAFLQVGYCHLILVRLRPAHVHAHQHRRPVLAFRTTGTGVDFEHTVHLVGFLTQHVLQLQRLDGFGCLGVRLVQFGFGDESVLAEVEGDFHLVGKAFHLFISVNPALQSLDLLHLGFRFLGVVPESGSLGAQLFFLHLNLLGINVQIAFQGFGTFLDIFQLFYGYHA